MGGQRQTDNDLLAISHNANLSDGRICPTEVDFQGRQIDRAYAASWMCNERQIETKQLNGQSETRPLLSPNDEFANGELCRTAGKKVATVTGSHQVSGIGTVVG
jgi:hypothetical protein